MQKKTCSIIGVSLATRCIGIAILTNGELTDWRIRMFKGKWSKQKLKTIILCIQKTIELYGASSMAIKCPDEARSSKALNELIKATVTLSKEKGLKVCKYTLASIKESILKNGGNRKALMKWIAEKNHELGEAFDKEQENKNRYYVKGFEAIAAATVLHQRHT